ncbi:MULTISPECIES: protein kinase domain-containing protein [unclassified Rhodococcus (in: high G+C Gram-positive bacteria)]|uniref:protein kinase domain-containing protein n=1 Tax=unclassified Rhodococcus (in: high G+C Gram-positive bacteria) TaxID=192944 RepID=UPI00163B3C37|nr:MULTISPECIES: protein kinase [unclassified Rhodococcus (in: high G+C Gram-positive bacteria)]MBC2642603.1 protein kinase [Rhodococcus sp. 3A]MBC2892655.1 protein kinase [Rhodococcus sp. 4CII]
MADIDPFETQRDATPSVASALHADGFDDAQEIGRGGFGVVYRCTEIALDRTVAVKVLTDSLSTESRERFLREQRAMGRLTGHPNIVNVLQVGVTQTGEPFIVMPYHPEGSLDTRIRQRGPLPLDDVLRLGVKLAGALEAAHDRGIVHRDVKPANVLLTEYGEPALTDFGIAHITGGFETETGIVTGSPAFTAPEVLGGAAPSPASDVYGLGATLFCALTGHAAFERRSGEQLVAQFVRITTEPAPDPREHGVPDDVAAVIEQAMSAVPEDRHPSALALRDALREIQGRRGEPADDVALHTRPPAEQEPMSRGQFHPSALDRARGNLPLDLSSFVGRRHEINEAKSLLVSSRLLTLVGIGGVGKTRLALRVASNIQREYSDGAWLIELDEVHTPSRLVDVVASTLGVRDQPDRSLRETVLDFLSSREVLLILDNCEQVLDAVADLATILLRQNPNVRILATSREPLAVPGEATLRVPPLTAPDPDHEPALQGLPRYDAVSLFTERATTAVSTFALTDANKTAVARICHRLDGLPLPIELAAARLRAMSPEQILQRLSDRYALLTRGSRGAPSRQQTLRLCVDWSYDLCTPAEQLMWARLSVFTGGFELDAAEFVCGEDVEPADVLDSVASLVDKSILIREEQSGMVRFRLLETLRAYGREKAREEGDYHALRRRHRDWFRRLARTAEDEFIGPRQLDWIARLGCEQPNLRDAMDFSLTEGDTEAGLQIATPLMQLWGSRGLLSEARSWLDEFLARHPQRPTIAYIRALYADCLMTEQQGDHHRGAALAEQAGTLAEQCADPTARAIADHADGIVGLFAGDPTRAASSLQRALTVFRQLEDDLALRIECLTLLGLVYQLDKDPDRAIHCYDEVLAITEDHGESVYRSYALWAMAVARFGLGAHNRAVELLEEGLRLARLVDDPVACANCVEVFAWIAGSDDPKRAGTLMGAAEALGRTAGSAAVFVPDLLAYHEECERTARRILTAHAFDAARQRGSAMDLAAAVSYALGESPPSPTGSTLLTKREQQVAELIAEGLTNKAIATRLVISPRTAQGHVEHILTKLGFTSRAQVAAWIVEGRQS